MPARVVRARLTTEAEHALQSLRADGLNESEAVRLALIEAARHRERAALREESRRLASDPEDRAEMRAVMDDMDALRAAWSLD